MQRKLSDNAILTFGMKSTMKKTGSVVLLALLSGLTTLVLVLTVLTLNVSSGSISEYAETGTVLFYVLSILHMIFGVFVTPAVAGTCISSEREKQTMDLLLCSQLMPKDVIIGKFLSSISWILLISVSLLPSYSVIYMIGGVPATAIIATFLYIIWMTAAIAAFAVFFSSVSKKSATSVVITYVVIFAIVSFNFTLFGIYYGVLEAIASYYSYYRGIAVLTWIDDFISPVAWFNPVVAFICILAGTMSWLEDITDILFGVMTNNPKRDAIIIVAVNVIFYSLLAFLFLRLAARAVDPMREHRRDRRKENKKAAKNA